MNEEDTQAFQEFIEKFDMPRAERRWGEGDVLWVAVAAILVFATHETETGPIADSVAWRETPTPIIEPYYPDEDIIKTP